MAQQPRRRLVDVELTGWRRGVRQFLVGSQAGIAALFLLTASFGRYVDVGVPLLLVAGVLILAGWAMRGGFGRGIAAGLVGSLAVAVAAILVGASQTFRAVDPVASPAVVEELCLPALFLLGPAIAFADLLHFLERRRLEARDPVFATARVVSHSSR